jgi:hypothetical protein
MTKKFIVVIMLIALLAGCSTNQAFNADNSLIKNEIPKDTTITEDTSTNSTEGDIEADINAEDIKEDEILTEKAEAEHKTEEDILVPQKDVEKIEENESEKDNSQNPETTEPGEPEVIDSFDSQVPQEIEVNLEYDKYLTSYNYLLILNNINIREKPTTESRVVRDAALYEKINLESKVKGEYLKKYNKDGWYKVFWKDKDEIKYGYVFETLGIPREFQFGKMLDSVNKLKKEVESNKTAYISNYKNRNGVAPLYKNQSTDEYGITRYQSAAAYSEPNANSPFRYIEDGTLVSVLEENKDFVKIRTLNFEGEYWVEKKFVSFQNSIQELTKAVVVDRNNQNEGVFEYVDGKWNLISYVFATTGEKSQFKQETPLGYFMAIETRPKFLYLDDVTREISGYAPYAIRFNGGAYIHGVPVGFKIVDGKRVDPGEREYLYTIGTTPRSHKCVRNYTSHAKFLYNWIDIGKSAVIVIE